jgi:hypothetical protein
MARNNQIQYIRPRCPKCKRHPNKKLRLGYDLSFAPAGNRVLITCNFCYYSWLSSNKQAKAEV